MYFITNACKLLVGIFMKKLILVNGDVAAGKSHLAIIIKDKFNLPLFTKDEFKEALAETHPYRNYEESHLLSLMAMDQLFDSFEKYAKEGKDVVLEANFRGEHLDRLEKLNQKYGYDILNIDLTGSVEVLHKRYVNRILHENRHPVHVVNDLRDFDKFKEYTLSRRSERKIGKVIIVNADDFSYQTDEGLFKQVEEFLSSK